MKKKQSKKKSQNKKKKNYSEKSAFANLEKKSDTITTPKKSTSGIPKYVADRMARRIFFYSRNSHNIRDVGFRS